MNSILCDARFQRLLGLYSHSRYVNLEGEMYTSALTELQAFLGDFALLLSRLGLHWKGDKGVRIALIGVEKDELTILVGIPITLYPTEEKAP